MSPTMRLFCVIALGAALMTMQASAARRLHMRADPTLKASPRDIEAGSTRSSTRRLSSVCANACSDILGTATNFGALAGTTVTSSGLTQIVGDVGTYPGTSIVGFPPGEATGLIRRGDSTATKGQTDAHIGYAYLQGLTYNTALSGVDLVGLTLSPGVYYFSAGAQLSAGNLTLDALGDSSALFVFQTTTTFVTAAISRVNLVNGAQPCNVYYQVGSSATLGAYSFISGNFVAYSQIALSHNTTVTGSLIALGAAVTMDGNAVTSQGECSATAAPPSTPPPSAPPPSNPPPASTPAPSPSPSNGTLVGGVLQAVGTILNNLG